MQCIVKPGVTRVDGKRVLAGAKVDLSGAALDYEFAQGNVAVDPAVLSADAPAARQRPPRADDAVEG